MSSPFKQSHLEYTALNKGDVGFGFTEDSVVELDPFLFFEEESLVCFVATFDSEGGGGESEDDFFPFGVVTFSFAFSFITEIVIEFNGLVDWLIGEDKELELLDEVDEVDIKEETVFLCELGPLALISRLMSSSGCWMDSFAFSPVPWGRFVFVS